MDIKMNDEKLDLKASDSGHSTSSTLGQLPEWDPSQEQKARRK